MNRAVVTILTLLVGACAFASICSAQTPTTVCAQDSLRLISPTSIVTDYSTTGRSGVTITWPDVSDTMSTCIAVVDTENIGVPVVLDGIYADEVDRELNMSSDFGGVIGAEDDNRVSLSWFNSNQALTGLVKGEINLSNSGGVLSYGDGSWGKINNGFYPFLPETNILHLCESPSGNGGMLVHLQGNITRGLWKLSEAGGTWVRIAEDLFVDGTISAQGISAIAYSPTDDNTFAVGTRKKGLFITRDGGDTFTQYQDEFTETGTWNLRRVAAISWEADDRLFVAIDQLGFYRSIDQGASYTLLNTFLVSSDFPTGGNNIPPSVLCILDRGSDGLLVGVKRFGLYETRNDGATWLWSWSSLLSPGAEEKDVISILASPLDPDHFTVGTRGSGLWWTPNRGDSWTHLAGDYEWPNPQEPPRITDLVVDESAGFYLGAADGFALLECAIGDTAWSLTSLPMPGNTNIYNIIVSEQAGVDYILGTYAGGIYTAGTQIRLTDTITNTDAERAGIDFGVYISFGEGTFESGATFKLVMQDFQGYAVWRGNVTDAVNLELIGLYDKSNPETCIDGYCGDESYNILPNCYADKRAACFDFSGGDFVSFFDENVYEGFTYYYAVTTFDYGNIAQASPNSMDADQLFSERNNQVQLYVVNLDPDVTADKPEIYAFPNPLRLDSGFTGAEGDDVRFKNLPQGSHVSVFTLDGDLVADLGPETQTGDMITWTTRNGSERIASGVYIYKVVIDDRYDNREDFFGKVVVIR